MSVPLGLGVAAPPALTRGTEDGTHIRAENHPWAIRIPNHPKRKDSAEFRASKRLAKKILEAVGVHKRFLGSDSLQMHHGGSPWVFADDGWFMLQNEAGIEWSAQFCANPAKVDALRLSTTPLCRLPRDDPRDDAPGLQGRPGHPRQRDN